MSERSSIEMKKWADIPHILLSLPTHHGQRLLCLGWVFFLKMFYWCSPLWWEWPRSSHYSAQRAPAWRTAPSPLGSQRGPKSWRGMDSTWIKDTHTENTVHKTTREEIAKITTNHKDASRLCKWINCTLTHTHWIPIISHVFYLL